MTLFQINVCMIQPNHHQYRYSYHLNSQSNECYRSVSCYLIFWLNPSSACIYRLYFRYHRQVIVYIIIKNKGIPWCLVAQYTVTWQGIPQPEVDINSLSWSMNDVVTSTLQVNDLQRWVMCARISLSFPESYNQNQNKRYTIVVR